MVFITLYWICIQYIQTTVYIICVYIYIMCVYIFVIKVSIIFTFNLTVVWPWLFGNTQVFSGTATHIIFFFFHKHNFFFYSFQLFCWFWMFHMTTIYGCTRFSLSESSYFVSFPNYFYKFCNLFAKLYQPTGLILILYYSNINLYTSLLFLSLTTRLPSSQWRLVWIS